MIARVDVDYNACLNTTCDNNSSLHRKEGVFIEDASKNDIIKEPRRGLVDIWNAHMVEGATFSANDIPFCPTTATTLPGAMITWDDAKHICKTALAKGEADFRHNAFVCFYLDDYKFDGPKGIWGNERAVLDVLRHFAGVITPDFSTYQDFPEPIKVYNTYRMRACGYWYGLNGLAVINNVRWGTPETWRYCWEGITSSGKEMGKTKAG